MAVYTDLARDHINAGDKNGDGVITSNEVADPYQTLFEAIDYHTNQDGELTLDELAGAYQHANIHMARAGTQGKCFKGSGTEIICEGDRIGDLQLNGGVQHDWQSARALAKKHIDRLRPDTDNCLSIDHVPEEYKTLWESINYHTNAGGQVCQDHLAQAYQHANIHEARSDTQGKCFKGSNNEVICEGDRIGALQLDGGVQHDWDSAMALAMKHINMGDTDSDLCISIDELRDPVYQTLWESIDHHTNANGKVCADHFATAYQHANIHEARSDAQGKCFRGSNDEVICEGDRIGDLQLNAREQHDNQSALDLAMEHLDHVDANGDGQIVIGELAGTPYETLFEAIDHHTNRDGRINEDELATAYKYANIQEAQ